MDGHTHTHGRYQTYYLPCYVVNNKRNSPFSRVARLGGNTVAQAIWCQIATSLGQHPDNTWKHPPGHPRSKWLDQICSDNNRLMICGDVESVKVILG